jgi:hypothetical protein
MLITAWIIGVIFGLGIGGKIGQYMEKNKCNHKWELIENGNIKNRGRHVGFFKLYECEHCKKMRKEQIEID